MFFVLSRAPDSKIVPSLKKKRTSDSALLIHLSKNFTPKQKVVFGDRLQRKRMKGRPNLKTIPLRPIWVKVNRH